MSTVVNDVAGVRAEYQQLLEKYQQSKQSLERRSRLISLLRFAIFIAGIAAFVFYSQSEGGWAKMALTAGMALTALFLAVVIFHRRVIARLKTYEMLCAIQLEGLSRLARDWDALPEIRVPTTISEDRGVMRDLDLTGRASLFQLIGSGRTWKGRELFLRWLLTAERPDEVTARQEVVAELRRNTDFLQRFELIGQRAGGNDRDPAPFLDWAESKPRLLNRPWVIGLSRLFGLAPIALGVLHYFSIIEQPLWFLAMLWNMLLTALLAKKVHAIFNLVSFHKDKLGHYSDFFKLISESSFGADRARKLQDQLKVGRWNATEQMTRLERISSSADLRYSSTTYLLVQALTLWDFHILYLLERWQIHVGGQCRRWLSALAEFDALAALALLAHDNPTWKVPAYRREDRPRLECVDLGHPLIPPESCVTNDVELGPENTFLLVTGSNMSGKSTLLRAVGLNVALAGAGGAVNARTMSCSPMQLATSFRIEDSLAQGISYFMAELTRLGQIVTLSQTSQTTGTPPVLYLLDEVLLGTNIEERRIAVQAVLGHLLRNRAIGAVSSHDLSLADAPELKGRVHSVHFTESFRDGTDGPIMHFDYKLRPGIATTTNALKLLEIAGISLRV